MGCAFNDKALAEQRVSTRTCSLVRTLLPGGSAGVSAGQQQLISGLLRTHALQAAARQLAEAAERLRAAPAGAAAHVDCMSALVLLAQALHLVSHTLGGLASGPSADTHGLIEAVAASLAESCVLEHAARLLLLLASQLSSDGALSEREERCLVETCSSYTAALYSALKLAPACLSATTRHALFLLGLTALHQLEGRGPAAEGHTGPCACAAGPLSRLDLLRDETSSVMVFAWDLVAELPSAGAGQPRPALAARLLLCLGTAVTRRRPCGPGRDRRRRRRDGDRHPPAGEPTALAWALAGPGGWRMGPGGGAAERRGAWVLPAEAPPSVAAALAGGALPLLERLLRRAGEDPAGPEAAALVPARTHGGRLLPLLAYADPVQAASFLTSAVKHLARTDPQLMLRSGDEALDTVLTLILDLLGAILDVSPASPTTAGTVASAPSALGRLVLVLSVALPELLQELSSKVQSAVDPASDAKAGGSTPAAAGTAGDGDGPAVQAAVAEEARGDPPQLLLLCLEVLFQLLHALDATNPSRPGSGSGSGPGSGPGSGSGDAGEWWDAELWQDEVVGLVGAALAAIERWAPAPEQWHGLYLHAAVWGLRLAEEHPEALQYAMDNPGPLAPWRPGSVRALAAALREAEGLAEGMATLAEATYALASHLDAWKGSGDPGAAPELPSPIAAPAWVPLLVAPAEARRRLGLPAFCSNPRCAVLTGDSEAGLPLQACKGCGRAAYCCEQCREEDWEAGHEAECGGGSAEEAQ
ncbi:hypothetical protein HYH03_009969 [Edaphochlamys debaryana]|uniref:MYND-type domain-containing protein n=1 Tax=Edaphochlamys debaryana TaxID=47281 RepID=A0A835Y6A5_9CHLO|nr:hypothetical protein HYH03_009969 [Edaphochlamys debaryana]|eukprot:KAG2491809.1 hypothetical protein HYH03_009969 [Edaphochlamys debaryana]